MKDVHHEEVWIHGLSKLLAQKDLIYLTLVSLEFLAYDLSMSWLRILNLFLGFPFIQFCLLIGPEDHSCSPPSINRPPFNMAFFFYLPKKKVSKQKPDINSNGIPHPYRDEWPIKNLQKNSQQTYDRKTLALLFLPLLSHQSLIQQVYCIHYIHPTYHNIKLNSQDMYLQA